MNVDSKEHKIGKYFLAIEVPESIRQSINKKVKNVLDKHELNVSNSDKYHITLFYIGFVPKTKALDFFDNLPNIPPFKVEISGIGYFNSNVIWLGINDVEGKLKEINLKFEQADYKPHVTLARNKEFKKESCQKIISLLSELNIKHEFIAKEIVLFESIATPEGHIYKRIAIKSLC